ncbi:MAG: polyprenol monophosphomannose synthase [Ardenticatenales bacterium]|nr:polyprenol monophosphomannose synthase [Ardenticatenales bacterium]
MNTEPGIGVEPRHPVGALAAELAGAVVVLPTYNEVDNITPLVESILAQGGIRAVVVVDDGSPDGTGRAADALAMRHGRRVVVLHRGRKLGLGTAYGAGFREAIQMGAALVCTMDADFSHDPAVLPLLLAAAADADLVIGSRYTTGGSIDGDWGWHRRFLSAGANALSRRVIGLSADDCTSGFRCYRASLLGEVDLAGIRSSGYSYLIEMLFRCQRAGARVAEVPIRFTDRRHGASKISRAEIGRAAETVVRLAWRRWYARRRLRLPKRPPRGQGAG